MNKLMKICVAAIFATLVLCTQTMALDPTELIAIREAAHVALNAHDIDLALTYFTEDAILDFTPAPTPATGKDQIRAFFEAEFESFPDWKAVDTRVLAAENVLVAEQTVMATQLGVWNGIPPTGNAVQLPLIAVLDFEGDKIKRLTSYADATTEMIQFGAMSVPVMPDLVPSIEVPDAEPTGLSPMEADVELIARWNSHDPGEVMKMIRPDAKVYAGPLGTYIDRSENAALIEMYIQGFSDIQIDVVRRIDLGDGWVLIEEVTKGTHDGPFLGVPPSGRYVETRVVWLTHYDSSGLVTDCSFYYDNLSLMTKISPKTPEFPPSPDYLIQDEIYSPSLEGNLMGDPATRPVLVYLPPSYENSPEKRYPTVYLLHGYITNHNCYTSSGVTFAIKSLTGIDLDGDLGDVVAELVEAGQINEHIVVMPNAVNSLGGSMYERSPLIGDYRNYIAKDLVDYIDGKYRTIAHSSARGIAGSSMGGYGALSLTIEYPEVFGAVAALSPAFGEMEVDPVVEDYMAKYPLVLGLPIPGSTPEDMWNIFLGYFEVNELYALAAAWSPNLDNPPFYVDLPVQYPGPTLNTDVWELWKDRDLVSQIERDGANLMGKPILIDEGRGPTVLMEEVAGIDRLVIALYDKGLSYTYDAFDGDHLTHGRYQLASALTFLSQHLVTQVEK